ncbi:serine protease 1 [Nesidiocoris tenuis]|uniref:Serine protease 1 n=1 Tax=Nesidiocoris tenuis TaxID=355587 RepID=A0ABN7BCX0_9HEMI|nr:serine protease 1 [Nesidiocoris tenuis]
MKFCHDSFIILLLLGSSANFVTADSNGALAQQCGEVYNRKLKTRNAQDPLSSSLGSSPWHVAIYSDSNNPDPTKKLDLKCGGVIINENAVLTAAGCVFIGEAGRVAYLSVETITVIAGLTSLSLKRNIENAQIRKVKKIHSHSKYDGEITGYNSNLAVLEVDQTFVFNDYILPICIDWIQRRKASPTGDFFQVSAWGLKQDRLGDNLQEASLAVIDTRPCRSTYKNLGLHRYINYDKFCVVTPQGRASQDEGSPFVQESRGRYYLKGVMGTLLNQKFSVATNITKHLGWLQDVMYQIDNEKSCVDGFQCKDNTCIPLDQKCDGVPDCPDRTDEGIDTCRITKISRPDKNPNLCYLPVQLAGGSYRLENCNTGANCNRYAGDTISSDESVLLTCGRGTIASVKGPRYACLKGKWFYEEPKCQRMCLPRKGQGVSVTCKYNNERVNCNEYMLPGTVVSAKCQKLFQPRDELFVSETKCLEDGKWSAALPACFPECGKPNPAGLGSPTITNGQNVTYGKYPWHVALLIRESREKEWEQSCGGTILRTNLVLTAAHCLFSRSTEELLSPDKFLVAAGKGRREWTILESNQQSSRVLKTFVPASFRGSVAHYDYDIAILELVTHFEINPFVLPCCIDYKATKTPTGEAIAMGWGDTNLQIGGVEKPSSHLLETKLKLISNTECRSLDKDFIPYVAIDKFCGLYRNNSGPQPGDSGGAIVMKTGELHFAIGIISVKKNLQHNFGAFTSVSAHLEWIKDVVRTFEV